MKTVFVMIGAVILILIIAGLNQSPEDKEKANNRDAISLCWENQAKKSNTPEEARFIAGACEMMG